MNSIAARLSIVTLAILIPLSAIGQEPRFSPSQLDSDGEPLTILDSATGRDWLYAAGQVDNWAGALDYCENLTIGDETNWSLPTILELASLVNTSQSNGVRFTDFFHATNFVLPLLSSTSDARQGNHVFFLSFLDSPGTVETRGKEHSGLAWCVRTH